MNYEKFLDMEWRDEHNGERYLYAYNDARIKLTDTPTLFIGIGGTGIQEIIVLKEKIDKLYHQSCLSKLEYLLIDTDEIPANINVNKEDQIVVQSADTASMLRAKNAVPDCIKSWLDDSLTPFRVMNGAAGVRQAGRLILFLNARCIYNAIQKKIERLSVNYDLSKKRIKVHIFTGIGGGTGSGMFVDISYFVKHICESVEVQGVIFMPDVSCLKEGLKDIGKRNIRRNGYAALKELDYLMNIGDSNPKRTIKQKYPGNIGEIEFSEPIFDYCILVGSKEHGRKAVLPERKIYDMVAEFVLSEIQQRVVNTFSLESFKSNVAVFMGQKNYGKYAAIGAQAVYILVDYYYSLWLCDVIATALDKSIVTELSQIKTLNNLGVCFDDYVHWNEKAGGTRKQVVDDFKRNVTGVMGNLLKNADVLKSIFLKDRFYDSICTIIRQKLNISWFRRNRYNAACAIFKKQYENVFREIKESGKDYYQYLERIYNRCKQYFILLQKRENLFNEGLLNELKKTNGYQDSVKKASDQLIVDYVSNKNRWTGEIKLGEERIWFSDYIARLLKDAFYESGCMSIMNLLELQYQSGSQSNQVYFGQILDELDKTTQLWPIKEAICDIRDVYENFSLSNIAEVCGWVDAWIKQNNRDCGMIPNALEERYAKMIFAADYEMSSYGELERFKREYNSYENSPGLHLYAVKNGIDWRNLPNP